MNKTNAMVTCALLWLPASLAVGAVRQPWVTTDRTVDCSDYQTILKGVITPGMSDEQKAIALYDFYRRMVYHYQNLPESRDPIKCINVLGNTLCGSQATCMKGLLEAAGLKVRIVSHPGHTFYEVFYGGKWHGYDTMTNFYVFTRGPNRNVASFEELNQDPSLISDAVKEGRACPGICPCGDKPMAFAQPIKVLNYQVQGGDWSVKDYSLRLGEEIVRSWWPHGQPLPGSYRLGKDPGPIHTCGRRDEGNPPELLRFWQPYGIRGFGGVSVSYRHYFNGWMSYSPDLGRPELKAALASGELLVPVKCPYYISGTQLCLEADCPGEDDAVDISISVDGGKSYEGVFAAGQTGLREYRTSLGSTVIRPGRGRHEYQLRFALKGKAALKRFHLKTIFTHNAMASPHLMPGRNKVAVTVADPQALKAEPLTVMYRYKDAADWTGPIRTVEKAVPTSPFTFEVALPETEKLPQMQDLTLRCGELHWEPPAKVVPDKVVFDFSSPDSIAGWMGKASPEIKITHDGEGMVMAVAGKATYPQARCAPPVTDWSEFLNVVVEADNLGPQPQTLVLRVQSNNTNDQRSDVELVARPGRNVLRSALAALRKTKLNAVSNVYLMTYQVPEAGCKVRIRKIYLEPKKPL
ncbi:MAG: hypothetical protein AMJ81_07615 [Phycisphaerae bacterium SM23_33]|nr:MAG: hypothetical protein AMJ81_07615 [Phycisphaerae bacterium SM23_33]